MVLFECVKIEGNILTYKYYPEGEKDHPGEFLVDKEKNEPASFNLSSEDSYRNYFFHALRNVLKGEESGIAFWY